MDFITKSKRSDDIEVVSYQLNTGTWQSDLMAGIGSRKSMVDRNQHPTEKKAREWAEYALRDYFERRIKPGRGF